MPAPGPGPSHTLIQHTIVAGAPSADTGDAGLRVGVSKRSLWCQTSGEDRFSGQESLASIGPTSIGNRCTGKIDNGIGETVFPGSRLSAIPFNAMTADYRNVALFPQRGRHIRNHR
jgi:hypothetical protein